MKPNPMDREVSFTDEELEELEHLISDDGGLSSEAAEFMFEDEDISDVKKLVG